MLTRVDITRLGTYRMGLEAGIEQGKRAIEEGIEQGIERGRREARQQLLTGVKQLLAMGSMDHATIASLFRLSLDEVEAIAAESESIQH